MAITSASQQEQNGIVSQMDDTCFFFKIYHAVVSLRFDFRIVEMWAMPHGEFDPLEIRIAVKLEEIRNHQHEWDSLHLGVGNESWIDWMGSLDRSIMKRIGITDYTQDVFAFFHF